MKHKLEDDDIVNYRTPNPPPNPLGPRITRYTQPDFRHQTTVAVIAFAVIVLFAVMFFVSIVLHV